MIHQDTAVTLRVQVPAGYYSRGKYNNLERFIAYFYQIELATSVPVVPQTILEIGPGNNLVASHLRFLGNQVTTCDFDPNVHPDVLADVRRLPLADKSYDLVMACEVLEHIPFVDLPQALGELNRVSRDRVLISVPYCSTGWEIVIKFPLIRRLFHRDFWDIHFRWPLRFGGFERSGQHYWELDRKGYRLPAVRKLLTSKFRILREFSPVLDKYHYFFLLGKLD